MVPSWRSEMGPWTAEFVRQVWGWQFSASAWWLLIIHWTCCVPCRPCLPIYYGEDSPASQDGATSACVPASPLGPRVFLPAPLAVGVVHSLPQEAGAEPPGKTTGHCDAGRSAHPTPGYTSCTTVPVSAKVRCLPGHREGLPAAWGLTCCPPLVTSGLPLPIALRPASMDLLHSHWLEVSRSSSRPQAAPSVFPPQQPGAPSASAITLSTGPGATYSNVGLPAIPRASLAASPVVWAGTQLTPGPGARPVLAEYASIQKLRGTDPGPQELQQGKAKVMPAAQVDVLYSRVCKPKIKDLGPTADHPDCMGTEAILALERDLAYEPLPLRRLGMDSSPLENVYESIREVGARASPEPPSLPLSIRGHSRPPRPLGKVWRPLS
ncbi:PREDICTED: lck-interacting transmembrane adapter 1 isoform X1 [Chinchilla lanigera]|uniref:lck-interacting transmembrane adapter 1 isoform X1 n=1 Tax=Chinchilla lanigera TaxID=34839 RepID=UPI00038F19ED|nr:PREDICTED: lck-interacting transmembrane adapter 1 isoform X1 [Chinchilla lanigera]